MRLPQRKFLFPGFALAYLVLVLIGLGAYRQGANNVEAAKWVQHTYEVRNDLAELFSLVQDVWGASRGYVITGVDSYLEPFNRSVAVIPQKLRKLRQLTADNPRQQNRLDVLERLVARRIAISQENIGLRRTQDEEAAEAAVSAGEGKQVMDQIREVVREMENEENQLLQQRAGVVHADNARTLRFFLLLVLLLAALLSATLLLVYKNASAQQRELELTEKARAHAENIVDTVREPLLVLNKELRILSANRSFYKTFQTTPAETEGEHLYGLGNRQWDIPELRKLLEEIIPKRAEFRDFEVEREFLGLGRRTMLLNARKTYRVGNNTQTLLLAIEDITERKRAEEQRDKIFTLSRDLICVAGFDGHFKQLNPAWEKTLGFTTQELMAVPFLDFVHPDDREETGAEAAKLAAGQETVAFENRYRCKDGSYRWFLWNATTSPDHKAVYGLARDITERKQAEAHLKRSFGEIQNRFETAVRASGQLLYEWDAKTNRVSYGNSEALGYSRDEIGDALAHWLELVHPDDRAAFDEEVVRSVQAKRAFHLEYRMRCKGEKYTYVEDRGYPIFDADGNVSGMVGLVADISGRKQLEEQFRQAQKMEAVGQLAGGVAHDFNNLLSVIVGYGDMVLESLPADSPTYKRVEEIRKAGNRATALTRQLLAFSRRQVLHPQVLDLNAVVSDSMNMLRRLVGEATELTAQMDPALDRIKADPGQLEQVVMNLVVNARDAMPKGGKITLATANVMLDDSYASAHFDARPGPHVMLAISDTGQGMDKDTQARIFEPFFTTKERGKGTGLGLSTVYGIVKQSGGRIWVYSEPGLGTTFKIFFPSTGERPETAILPEPTLVARGSGQAAKTILLAEDEDSLRTMIQEQLSAMGYKVLAAPNGAEALRLASKRKEGIDLLISDVVMPGMSGPVVASQVAALHPQAKVLYMSGYADDALVRDEVLSPGMTFLEKPFTKESLAKKVYGLLERT